MIILTLKMSTKRVITNLNVVFVINIRFRFEIIFIRQLKLNGETQKV